MDFDSWVHDLRGVLQEQEPPITLNDGHWKVANRRALWQTLGSRIFDAHLDELKACAIEILSEIDPQFELPAEERYAASIHGKVLKHSLDLRQGMAETLALLGNHGDALTNCSRNKAETIAILSIRGIFENADWRLWGSLNNLLPTLAEAAPGEFLTSVENALGQTPCPFDELFAQENSGVFGNNYMTGLLWGLESLSWNDEYLVRVSIILAELATHDPGGNWTNRPSNSLTTILLPWFPQTRAPIDKRIVCIKAIRNDFPDIAWKLLLSLLPNQHQTSSGAHKPQWHNPLPKDWKPVVTKKEYWEQITSYAEIAVEMAFENLDKLRELVSNLDNLPKPSFDDLLNHLSSKEIRDLSEKERLPIWTSLTDFSSKHRRFSEAKWALEPEIVERIEKVANGLAPESPEGLYKRLFSNRDLDLYNEHRNWEEQRKKLDEKRRQAIQTILDTSGSQGILDFVDIVDSPGKVGFALGYIADENIDTLLLPEYLDAKNNSDQQFVGAFIWSRYQNQGWQWVDALDKNHWTIDQARQLLIYLPFEKETWNRVNKWLVDFENSYWEKVPVNPYQSEDDLLTAVDKLLEVSRPQAAIDCLHSRLFNKLPLDSDRTVRALLEAVSTKEIGNNMDTYQITELIKALQDDTQISQDDLFKVEWAYLPLLERSNKSEPKILESRLATEPEFFCEIIQLIYRSKNEDKEEEEVDESKKTIATNAWRLLHEWQKPPGLQEDGSFSVKKFEMWLKKVKQICIKTGHFEVAMISVGEVLFYCPVDPQGLWIVQAVAKALNARDAGEMRDGFRTEVYNSRGVHGIDPNGKPERELAEQWRQKADDIENVGFARFATTLRELADSYDREAERIITEHKIDTESYNDDENKNKNEEANE
jgi:hypothetical protein